MSRVKRGFKARQRRKGVLKLAKGYYGRRKNNYKVAHETVLRAGVYAFTGRRDKKGNYRKLWIQRLNAAARAMGLNYSRLMHILHNAKVGMDRRMLSDMALRDPQAFKAVVDQAKARAAL